MKPNWFVALPVPAPWLPALVADLPESCRAFAAGDIHMTVAFLGAMDPARAPAVIEVIEALPFRPVRVGLGEMLALPAPQRVSALSLAVGEGHEEAATLIGSCRESLWDVAGARHDERPPLPHVTVARPLRKFGQQGQREALAWADRCQPPADVSTLNGLALYTWAEDRGRQQFRILYQRSV